MPRASHSPRLALAPPCPTFDAGAVWPVRGGVQTVPTPTLHPGRAFGAARRKLGLWHHWHCGIDLYADGGQVVQAIDDGVIVSVHPFYRSITGAMTWAVIVRHERCHVLYGELHGDPGDAWDGVVHRGVMLGIVSRRMRTPMLHLETYAADLDLSTRAARRRLAWRGSDAAPPSGLFDPTSALQGLARL